MPLAAQSIEVKLEEQSNINNCDMDVLLKDLALSIYDGISSVLEQSSDVSEQLYSQQGEDSVQNSSYAAVEESSLVSQTGCSSAAPGLTNPEEHLNVTDCLACENDTTSGKNNRSGIFKEHEEMSENIAAIDSDSLHIEHLSSKPVSSEIQKILTSSDGAIVVYILETEISSPSMRLPSCAAVESSVSQAAGLANLETHVQVIDCLSCENDGLSDKNNGSDNMVKEDEEMYENTTAIDNGSLQKGYLCSEPVSTAIQEIRVSPDVAIDFDALETEITIPSLRLPEKIINTQLIMNKRSSDERLSSSVARAHEDLQIPKTLTNGFIEESVAVTRTTGEDKIIQSPLSSGTSSAPTRQEIENDFQIECTNEASDLTEVLVTTKEKCVNGSGDCSHLQLEAQSQAFPETGVPEKQLFFYGDGDGRCQTVNDSGDCSHLQLEAQSQAFPETGVPEKQLFSDGHGRCQTVNRSGDCSHLQLEAQSQAFPGTGVPEKQLFFDGDGRCQTVNGSGDCSHLELEAQSQAFPETGVPEKQLFSVDDDDRFTTVNAGSLEYFDANKILVAEKNIEPRRKFGRLSSRICRVKIASWCCSKQNNRPHKARSSNMDKDIVGSSVLGNFKSHTDMAVTTSLPQLKSQTDVTVTTSLPQLKHMLFPGKINESKSIGQATITESSQTSKKKSKEFHKVTKKDDTGSVNPRKKRKSAAVVFTYNFANASREKVENEKIVSRRKQHFSKPKPQKAESMKSGFKSLNKSYSLRSTFKFKMHMLPSAKRNHNLRDIKSGKDKSWLCKSNKQKITSERIVTVRRSNRLAQTIRKSWKDHKLNSEICSLCMAHTQTMTKGTQAGGTKNSEKANHIINSGMKNQTVSNRAMSKHRHSGTTENREKKMDMIYSRKNKTLLASEECQETSRKATSVGVAPLPLLNKKIRNSAQPYSTMARKYKAPDKPSPAINETNFPEYTVGNPMIVLHEISLNSPQGVAGFIASLSSLGLPNITADVSTGNNNGTPSPQVVQALNKHGYSIDDGWLVIKTVSAS